MKWTKFMRRETIDNEQYIINLLNRAVIQVSDEDLSRIEDNGFRPSNEDDRKLIEILREDWFLIEDDFDEVALVRYYTNKLKYTTNETGIDATVLTTYSCNMSCSYCYETGVKEHKNVTLKESVTDSIISWLVKYADMKKVGDIFVDFYGGEPLLNKAQMIYFMKQASKSEHHYRFSAVTNGVLLTKEVVSELKPLGFLSAQVTLDGPRHIHDQRRRMKSGKGTFDIIMNNLTEIIDEIGIGLSINTDRQNHQYIPEFLDILAEKGFTNKIDLAFNIVQPAVERQTHCQQHIFTPPELAESQFELYKIAVAKGFHVEHRILAGVCRAQHDFSIVIDPIGDIYPCPATVGIREFYSGNVTLPINEFYRLWAQQIGYEAWDNEKCYNCEYLPICLGGCRHQNFTRNKTVQGPLCQKGSFRGDARIMILHALQNQVGENNR